MKYITSAQEQDTRQHADKGMGGKWGSAWEGWLHQLKHNYTRGNWTVMVLAYECIAIFFNLRKKTGLAPSRF